MGNIENLKGKGFDSRTTEERREIARQGGLASAEKRKARKTLKEELLALLSDGDIQRKISIALIQEATEGNRAGSVTKAFEVIRDTVGEKPIEKVMISEVEQSVIDEVENAVLGDDEDVDKGTST